MTLETVAQVAGRSFMDPVRVFLALENIKIPHTIPRSISYWFRQDVDNEKAARKLRGPLLNGVTGHVARERGLTKTPPKGDVFAS